MKSSSAYSPASISCIFAPYDGDSIASSGSLGLGITLTPGVISTARSARRSVVKVNGKIINAATATKVWAFYKPAGLVTTHKDEQGRQTVFDYLKESGINERVISVGRLDLNSEGLLLLTNSGDFAQFAESPKTEWERIYRVRVFGAIQNIDFDELLQGITIEGVNYRKVIVEPEQDFKHSGKNAWLRVTLKEGKNREIRKIMEYFDLQVNRLIRISYGPYSLENLKPGQWKEVKECR